ncbi:MAG: 4-alpha-glucanotransferase [Christensenellales bacterium]|jgi:4-alpha-glucanotransferase
MENRTSGILLNIASMPGSFGIGDFSCNVLEIIDDFAIMGFHWLQTLPITAIGEGNSPYSSPSAFALNYLYLDPYSLPDRYLTKEEITSFVYRGEPYLVDYEYAKRVKKEMLEIAYSRINEVDREAVSKFVSLQEFWISDYALYMSLKDAHNGAPWYEWEQKYKFRYPEALKEAAEIYKERIYYYYFEQYILRAQWEALKKHADSRGFGIFGDMPIYVSYDSADVWANPGLFQLDENLNKKAQAGVPPDYYSATGQLWGNPLYDYEVMRKDNYNWLTNRIAYNLSLYHLLRIDHFRGFYEYWAVDKDASSAEQGAWKKGPEMEIWEALRKKVPNPTIVAEDLGIINDKVRKYVERSGFYGMRVMQFGFDGKSDNPHLPHNYIENCIAYSATHDNNTTLGWLYELDNEGREYVLNYIGYEGNPFIEGKGYSSAVKAFVRTVLASKANLAIIPVQDICGFGADTRLNVPGVAEGNWRFRLTLSALSEIDRVYYSTLNRIYGRNNKSF